MWIAFPDRNIAVDGQILIRVCAPARPADRQRVRALRIAEAEVDAPIRRGKIRTVRLALPYENAPARLYREDGPVPVPVALRSDELHAEPVSRRLRLVVQQQRLALAVYHERIDSPVVIIVADGEAAPDDGADQVHGGLADVLERRLPRAGVVKQLRGLA